MKKITKILALFGFLMINSYAFTESAVYVTVKLPNETFELTESIKFKKTAFGATLRSGSNQKKLLKGPAEKTFHWNAANDNAHYIVHRTINGHQVDVKLDVAVFKGHRNWTWSFNDNGSYNLVKN